MPAQDDRDDVMTLEEFKQWFTSDLDWAPEVVSEDDDLILDLGMDSVGAVDLLVGIEDAVGGDVIMPIELMLEINTVRDAYLQYCALAHLPLDTGVRR